jgi:hypothetical protein
LSKYDELRKNKGLPVSSGASSRSEFYKQERERRASGQKSRIEEVKDRDVDNQRFAAKYTNDPRNKEKSKKTSTSKKSKKNETKKTNTDEERDGILGFVDRYITPISKGATEMIMPGNQQRMELNAPNNPVVKAAGKDRGLETDILNTIGMIGATAAPFSQGYKATNFALGKAGVLGKVTNPYAQKALTGGIAGGLTEAGLAAENEFANSAGGNFKDYALRTGLGVAGGAVLDPALYGLGRGISKGAETVTTKAMKNLLPDNNQLGKELGDTLKSFDAVRVPVQDFPNVSNTPKASALNDLLPQGNDITNPNYVSSLNNVKPQEPIVNSPFKRFDVNNPVEQPRIQEPIQQQVLNTVPKGLGTPLERPQHIARVEGERQHFSTVTNSEKSTNEFVDAVKRLDKRYTKISDKEVVDFANEIIKRDIEEAYQFVKNASRLDKRHNAVAFRLIDEFQARGETERAVDMVELSANELTKAGQTLQSATLYNRLSVEGHLIAAQRQINRMNDKLGVNEKKVVLTKETTEHIVQSVETMKRMTGFEETGNNIQTIMEKWKKGNAPTDDELDIVRSFMSDYKKFVGDMAPRVERTKVKPVKEVRNRDKVVEFMGKQEELAMKRIKERMKRANSLPLDMIIDLGVVGASKIAKGTVKMADFTEAMIKEFGEEIRPYMNQIWDKAAETFNLQTEKLTSKKLSEIEKITEKALKDKTIAPDEMDKIREFAKKISTMSGDTKFDAQMELQATLNLLERPTFAQKLSTTHSISLLLNPLTMVRNIIGNEVSYRVDRMSKMMTIVPDMIRSKTFGTQRTIVFTRPPNWKAFFFQETKDYAKGFSLGFKGGLKGVNPLGLQTAYDIRSDTFRSKYNPLRYFEKALGASLRSFDTAGYYRAYNAELRHQAMLKAVNEGLKGKAARDAAEQYFRTADENMQALAEEYGKYVTFQNDTIASNLLTKAKQGLNYGSSYMGTLGLAPTKEFGLGTAIIPFAKTPGNLIMRAIEYSPAGFLRSISLAKNVYKFKNIKDTEDLQLSLSRAVMGSAGFSLFGFILAEHGVLTAAGHSDYEVASLERNAGKQANSVNISAVKRFLSSGFDKNTLGIKENDTFVSFDWMQPISVAVALGTGVNQSSKEQGELKPLEAGLSAVNSVGKTIINMSALSGLNDFISTYNGKELSDYFKDPAQGLPSTFVPTLSNQIRKLSDNTARNTYSPDLQESTLNKAINRIPGKEKSLPPAYDTLGNKRELYQDGTNNFMNVFFNPSFVSKYKPSEEAQFVLDYINQTGDKTVAPRFAPKQIDGIKLTGAQRSEMQRILGEEVQKGLEKTVPKLQGSNDFEKIHDALFKVLDKAGDKARKEMRKELGK